ncbi:GerAB/ArcD/ProY family transporter [Paenibacillus sp. UNC451MF]|uniref:GerAB/ArcD/ProY family transporter n=1 Tax=Paenibacillus sp. UNC451MF TaxID=1449063 RepID=UPI00048EBA5D|nr:endospore germination permease [Paenibacillus sp. UNC451MF]
METPSISLRQAFWLFVNSRFIITLVFIPQLRELSNAQDIIPALLFELPMELLYVLVFVILWLQYPNQTLIEYSRSLLGRYVGSLVGLLFIWYFIHNASITVRVFIEFLATRFFDHTPVEVIGASILIMCAYCVNMGLEVLARSADFLVPLIFVGLLVIITLTISSAEWGHVIPLWEQGAAHIALQDIPSVCRWNELAWMSIIMPFIVRKQHILRVVWGGITFAIVYWFLLIVPLVALFGPEIVQSLQFPTYELVEIISVGQFFERIDALVLGLWVFGAFLKISMFYYAATAAASQWLGLQRRQTIVLPVGMIIFSLSLLLYANVVELRNFGKAGTFYDLTFVLLIPAILLAVHLVKRKFRLHHA